MLIIPRNLFPFFGFHKKGKIISCITTPDLPPLFPFFQDNLQENERGEVASSQVDISPLSTKPSFYRMSLG